MITEAVCALIINGEGKILAVSRKDNPNDWGLPGGKINEGESLWLATHREVLEETGLNVITSRLIFSDKDNDFLVHTYICTVEGEINTKETGLVKYVNWNEIIESSSFADYNKKLRNYYLKEEDEPKIILNKSELKKLLNEWGNEILNNPVSNINEFLKSNIYK